MFVLRYYGLYGLYDLCIRACVPPFMYYGTFILCLVSCFDILIVSRPELDSGGVTSWYQSRLPKGHPLSTP